MKDSVYKTATDEEILRIFQGSTLAREIQRAQDKRNEKIKREEVARG